MDPKTRWYGNGSDGMCIDSLFVSMKGTEHTQTVSEVTSSITPMLLHYGKMINKEINSSGLYCCVSKGWPMVIWVFFREHWGSMTVTEQTTQKDEQTDGQGIQKHGGVQKWPINRLNIILIEAITTDGTLRWRRKGLFNNGCCCPSLPSGWNGTVLEKLSVGSNQSQWREPKRPQYD